ncbi:hypothetical protein CCY99_06655 [Helicobacter sp. 16-1353]|uniref:hypothetical protein n=1 Tax=Helicobacter sp. 16-1353 TaxID=2004996 RepID=UPI000DCE8F72|nr:hypothetical protein [Helicobacter sp. 16-1353]RAX53043.1 hypothetical protein CCY99_06655 [Helicobacter sp. 16-1353]
MKIDSNNIVSSKTLDSQGIINHKKQIQSKNKIGLSSDFIDNGYSSLKTRELNNNIGILQIADRVIDEILRDNNITLEETLNKLENATFLNKPIFVSNQILKDSNDNILFDANRILDILPKDKKDIYIFKKALRVEHNFIVDSINNIKNDTIENINNIEFNKDFLHSNSNLFQKAHNVAGLASKIDALLA